MSINRMNEKGSAAIYMGDSLQVARQQRQTDEKGTVKQKENIFAGNLNMNQDLYSKNKDNEVKRAVKAIMDEYRNQLKVDENINESVENQKQMQEEAKAAQGQIDNLRKDKEGLKDNYGVSEDSQEQKDLELLQKSMDSRAELTEEEQKRLEEIPSLTEYQKDSLSYDTQIGVWQQRKDNAAKGYEAGLEGVIETELQLLKSHGMTDAQTQAANIMQNAAKKAVGQLMQEAKESIDEEMEKQQEEAEKIKEKREEQEEKIEKAKENSSTEVQNNVQAESESQQVFDKDDVDKEIKEFMKKQKLLEEDIKGLSVDQLI